MTALRDRLVERRALDRDEAPLPIRPALKPELDDPACLALRAALRHPLICPEAKHLIRQSGAALVAMWTPKEDPNE